MKIAIGCDHGGLDLKKRLIDYLKESDREVSDFGTYSKDSVDYPDIAFKVALEVAGKKYDFGIIIDTTGIASAIAANKVKVIRATPCYNTELAISVRQHNESNILTLAVDIIRDRLAKNRTETFLKTEFAGGRHLRRVNKISNYETEDSKEQQQYEKPKEVVTRDDLVILQKQGKKVLYISEKTIITPLAKEFARDKGIRLIKR